MDGRTRRLTLRLARRVWCVAMLGTATPALAQTVTAQPATTDSVPVRSSGSAPRWQFDQCMGGLTYGAPLKWALAYGMGMVRETDTHDVCFLGAGKVGFGGASFSVGVANSLGRWGSGTAATVGVLRTFNDPMGAMARRTYLGGSVHVWPVFALGGEVGYYTRVGADPTGTPRGRGMITWSTGFGF
jgi:hypothetical protein